MSMQSLASTVFTSESAVAKEDNPRRLSLFDCIFDVLTMTTAKTDEHRNEGDKDKLQLQVENTADEKRDEPAVVGENKVDVQNPQQDAEAADSSKATAKEAEYARNNWLELRARVESVDPRVFAYQKDPKYLQQCEEAKQRRALAVATSVSPSWH
ncbi:hypothetical protein JG688_00009681 [Phytophthora aleatoria]|uniref:Uncharacterized protein n=1 Tax=Phytophthora aleatoria TaxID=2496075 RepID=A0A8J5ITD3_9STRA|nr:hypothetical protein JG688_00009681 [Phytophthora aleatoria]